MNNVMMRGSFCLFGLAALCAFAAEGPETNRFEMLYEKWHAALRAHPFLTPPMFFLTEGVPQDLASVVREIERDKLGMALYLCEKIAARENMDGRLFFDVRLLDEVSGVNLWYSERPTEKGGDVIAELTARFRDEWRQGLYKDPSSKVAQLCLEKFPEQASEEIDPRDLATIRRYGIFGLPELIRQIKKNDSKHAFAAALLIMGEKDKYSDYIRHSNQQFKTKQAKLVEISARTAEIEAKHRGKIWIVDRISAALAE